jgi:hypothetical protein
VTKADRYDLVLQRTMAEYARHRGLIIDPAPVRMPRGRARTHTAPRTSFECDVRHFSW